MKWPWKRKAKAVYAPMWAITVSVIGELLEKTQPETVAVLEKVKVHMATAEAAAGPAAHSPGFNSLPAVLADAPSWAVALVSAAAADDDTYLTHIQFRAWAEGVWKELAGDDASSR